MKHTKFHGFPKETIPFLMNLRCNNNREWFEAHKASHKEYVDLPAKMFLADMQDKLEGLTKHPMSGKIFRIHRDIRFSKDKTPYNAYIHILFYCSDKMQKDCGDKPAFFFSLDPDKVTVGVGNFEFPRETLVSYREAVADNTTGGKLQKLLSGYTAKQGFRLDEPELKRVPTGYDKDHLRETLLRRKGLVIWHEHTPGERPASTEPSGFIMTPYKAMMPLYHWLEAL